MDEINEMAGVTHDDKSIEDNAADALEEQPRKKDTNDEDTSALAYTSGKEICNARDDGLDQCEEVGKHGADSRGENKSDRRSFMVRTAERFPRMYHLFMGVILPLMALICLSLLFGYGLAKLEAPGEIESNDALLRNIYQDYIDYAINQEDVRNAIRNVHPQCLQEFDNNATSNALNESNPELFPYLETCYKEKAEDRYSTVRAREFYASLFLLLDFNWLNCPRSVEEDDADNIGVLGGKNKYVGVKSFDQRLQTEHYVSEFHTEFLNYFEEGRTTLGMEDVDAVAYGLERATGSAGCKPHVAAGALFWFTVMTTIGYGNTAPVTGGGRTLIFTLGFLSIIAFTGLIGQAGYVILTIADDAFQQHRWTKALSRGLPAVLFWLTMLVLWMLFFAQMARVYSAIRHGYDDLDLFRFKDAVWFAYITMTTVGFGDFYLSHEEFVIGDMFYLPLIVLLGFVWLANFALKLSVFLMELLPVDENPLEDLLVRQRARKTTSDE